MENKISTHRSDDLEFRLLKGMIDTHFHGSVMRGKGMDTASILLKAIEKGLAGGIDVGLSPDDYKERIEHLKPFPAILPSAGCYPSETEKESVPKLLEKLEEILANEPPSAIGEIGLDWHWNYGSKSKQKELFEGQLDLANKYYLPVLIHNREADKDIIDILKSTHPVKGGILHCFSSDYETAKKLIDMGIFISFAGNLTYKKNITLRETAAKIPVENLFLETDSPYLSPQKRRGKLNHPGHIGYTYETLAETLEMDVDKLIKQIRENYTSLFLI